MNDKTEVKQLNISNYIYANNYHKTSEKNIQILCADS